MKTISPKLADALVKLRAAQINLAEWELGKLRGFKDEHEGAPTAPRCWLGLLPKKNLDRIRYKQHAPTPAEIKQRVDGLLACRSWSMWVRIATIRQLVVDPQTRDLAMQKLNNEDGRWRLRAAGL